VDEAVLISRSRASQNPLQRINLALSLEGFARARVLQSVHLMAPVECPIDQRRIHFLIRLVILCALFIALVVTSSISHFASATVATQGQAGTPPPKPPDKNQKGITAEQVAEITIFSYGSRAVLSQIRRNGVERGRITRFTSDGKTEESTYERRFVRGESLDKDKVRIDQRAPTLEYSLIYSAGRLWGVINGASFTPRQDAANIFMSTHRHSIDTHLRYKEDNSTLKLLGDENKKGLDLYVLELVDKDKESTRYYISKKSFHVMWLEYEDASASSTPVKFRRTFHDYRFAQSTLVPYRSVLLEDGKQTQETRVLTITYGAKVDDSIFKSPES